MKLTPVLALAAGLAAGLALPGVVPAGEKSQKPLFTDGAPPGGPTTGITASTPVTFGAFAELAKRAAPAVVSIEIEGKTPGRDDMPFFFGPFGRGFGAPFGEPGPARGAGSGFIIRADGFILSNNHVVENAVSIHVKTLDGKAFEARLVGRDEATDLALLKVDPGKETLPVVPLGNSDALEIGEWVVAIGNPLGLAHTVTAGIVSAKHRGDVRPDGRLRYADFIQTDASINPGNSGGPLFNTRGEVVGINTAIRADGQGIGFAIPINMVKTLLPQLEANGKVARSWIGIQIQEVTPALATSFGLDRPRGALVASVVPGGPAAKAGLRDGDVVTRFDGTPIDKDEDLPWRASTAGVGRTVDLEVYRDGKPVTVRLKLEAMPDDDRMARRGGRDGMGDGDDREGPGRGGAAALGLTLVPADEAHMGPRGGRGATLPDGGALVARIENGSAAARAGLERGDVIVQVDGQRVDGPKQAAAALEKTRPGDVVRLLVLRGPAKTFIAFRR
ncbi:trypsin-like peptidase domain-containing protein [Myxococcota bacterium]|nr:trypsin-like peptidase domain-containing protein [Myxococcota bacterium]